jgi:hypothetical protein
MASTGGLHDGSPGLNPLQARVGRTANVGGLALSLGVDAALEYNDNVRVEPVGQSGVIASAGLRFDAAYQLTRLQELSLKGQIGERIPLSGPGRRQQLLSVAPDSALRFNLWVASIRISPFFKYRRQLDPILSPVVNRTEILDQRAVTLGVQADLPMHESDLQLLVFRERRSQLGEAALAQTSWNDVGAIRYRRALSKTNQMSADVAVVEAHSEGGPSQRSNFVTFGVHDDWRLSPAMALRVGAGVARNRYVNSRVAADDAKVTTPFLVCSFDHSPRENLSYVLRYHQSTQEGVSTNFYRLRELSLTPRYLLTTAVTLDLMGSYQWVRESGPTGERGTRWTAGAGLGYNVTADLNVRLAFDRVAKQSNLPLRAYRQNRLTLSAQLEF